MKICQPTTRGVYFLQHVGRQVLAFARYVLPDNRHVSDRRRDHLHGFTYDRSIHFVVS